MARPSVRLGRILNSLPDIPERLECRDGVGRRIVADHLCRSHGLSFDRDVLGADVRFQILKVTISHCDDRTGLGDAVARKLSEGVVDLCLLPRVILAHSLLACTCQRQTTNYNRDLLHHTAPFPSGDAITTFSLGMAPTTTGSLTSIFATVGFAATALI